MAVHLTYRGIETFLASEMIAFASSTKCTLPIEGLRPHGWTDAVYDYVHLVHLTYRGIETHLTDGGSDFRRAKPVHLTYRGIETSRRKSSSSQAAAKQCTLPIEGSRISLWIIPAAISLRTLPLSRTCTGRSKIPDLVTEVTPCPLGGISHVPL